MRYVTVLGSRVAWLKVVDAQERVLYSARDSDDTAAGERQSAAGFQWEAGQSGHTRNEREAGSGRPEVWNR